MAAIKNQVIRTAEGVAVVLNGDLGRFGAAHPRVLAAAGLAVGLVVGWLVHFH